MDRVRAVLWTLPLVAACGNEFGIRDNGDDGDINSGQLKVEPPSLEFPPLTSRDFVTQTVTVTNIGLAAVSVDEVRFTEATPGAEGSYVVAWSEEAPFVVPRGESVTFDVTFQPLVGGTLPAEVRIVQDADVDPEIAVPITGIGQMPRLVIEPDPIDFGSVFIPCEEQKTVVIKNLGPEPAVIDEVFLAGEDADMLELVGAIPEPLTLFENGQQLATVVLDPIRKANLSESLSLDGNDPSGVVEGKILGSAVYAAEVTDTFEIPSRFPVDIVIGVDQSGSMQSLASTIRSQFQTFINQLENATLDWKIGVITHDRGGANTGCFNGGSSGGITNVAGWQSTLSSALFPGGVDDDDALTEALLAAVELGLDRSGSGDCNAGFGQGRSPSQPPPLVVIVVSNERDQSEFEDVQDLLGRSVSSDGATRANDFVSRYQTWAGANAEVKVHGIIDPDFDLPSNPDCGGLRNGPAGYLDAIQATGGFSIDVCANAAWAAAFNDITQDVIQGAQALKLSRPNAWPESIRVTVDGTREDDGWVYDASRNAVVFDDPPRGSDVEVFYGVAADSCP